MSEISIVVNCRFLTQPITGVQRFAENISLELKKTLQNAIFVSPRDVLNRASASLLEVQTIGERDGHAWEQIDLPRFLKRNGSPLLLNLANTAPLFYKNKISTLHDIAFVRYPENFSLLFRYFYRYMAPRLVRDSKVLITVSEFSKREICGYYGINPANLYVVPNAVDIRFSPKVLPSNDIPYILAVSSPNLYKNFTRIITAYSSWDRRNEINLRIVGGGAGGFSKQEYGKIPEGVKFLGRVDDERLIELYSNALGFVFPSLYEGFGIPPLEAQACDCPVIASRAASIPEVLGDSALYFDPLDVHDIISAMNALISLSSKERDEIIAKSRENVARFSWQSSADKLAQLIQGQLGASTK